MYATGVTKSRLIDRPSSRPGATSRATRRAVPWHAQGSLGFTRCLQGFLKRKANRSSCRRHQGPPIPMAIFGPGSDPSGFSQKPAWACRMTNSWVRPRRCRRRTPNHMPAPSASQLSRRIPPGLNLARWLLPNGSYTTLLVACGC